MSIYIHLFFLFFIAHITIKSAAQNIPKWSIYFGSEEFTGLARNNTPEDLINDIIVASDGSGYYISGTNNQGSGTAFPNTMGTQIARFDQDGKLIWWNCPGIQYMYYDNTSIAPARDGGLIATGNADCTEAFSGKTGIVFFKHDKNGNCIFEKVVEAKSLSTSGITCEKGGNPWLIYEISDGVFKAPVALGTKITFKSGNMTVVDQSDTVAIVTYNFNTDQVTAKFLNIKMQGDVRAVVTKDKGIIIWTNPSNGFFKIWKFNENDELEWNIDRKVPCDYSVRITCDNDNQIVISLITAFSKECKGLNTILLLDKDGKEILETKIDIFGNFEKVYLKDGFYYTVYNDEEDIGKFNFIKFNKEGKIEWKRKFGQKNTSGVSCFEPAKDNGFIILAITEEFGAQYMDAWILKTDSLGNAPATPVKYQRKK